MKAIGDWTLVEMPTGHRAIRTAENGVREMMTATGTSVSMQHLNCSDAVFDALRRGATLTDEQLMSIEFVGARDLPMQVLRELLL